MCVCARLVTIWVREDSRFSGTGATYVCESSCGCWELNLGPLREQQVLLTDGHLSSSSLANFKIWFLILCFCDYYYYYYCVSFCFVCSGGGERKDVELGVQRDGEKVEEEKA